jgi:DNA-binding transcriptional regulator YiaG
MTPAEITARRKALGLSQEVLASRLGVRQATVSAWENGHAAPPSTFMLAAAFERLEREVANATAPAG